MAVIDEIILKSRHVEIPESFKKQALEQLHLNQIRIEKTKLLAGKLIYWITSNDDIENYIKLLYMSQFSANPTKRKDNLP